MTAARLEHLNVTVTDPTATAAWLGRVFGWRVRWQGPGMTTGRTIHCGTDDTYVALFSFSEPSRTPADESYRTRGGLNHWAVVVDDLDETETRIRAEGFEPHSHASYEPGRRFYFHDADVIEIEVVAYG